MGNDPVAQSDPHPLEVKVILPRRTQISSILDAAERCGDIVEDIETIPGWSDGGVLLGIRAVAQQQKERLENIAANMLTEDGYL